MQLQELKIYRTESYQTPANTLKASATFKGPDGQIEMELSPGFIVDVIHLIQDDAAKRAKRLASAVPSAIKDAESDAILLEVDRPLQLGE